MNELQRQRYLTAMGIESFVPRLILPHAPRARQCPLPEPQSSPPPSQQPVMPAAQRLPAEKPVRRDSAPVGKVLQEMGVGDSPKPVRKTPLQGAMPRVKTGVKPVHLHLWRPNDTLVVIDHSTPGAALPTDKLLTNILLACRQLARPLPNATRLKVPPNETLARDYTESHLRDELHTWLGEEMQKQPARELWIFGGSAARFFIGEDTQPETFRRVALRGFDTQSEPTHALVLPSLLELLQKPELKRGLWEAIRSDSV